MRLTEQVGALEDRLEKTESAIVLMEETVRGHASEPKAGKKAPLVKELGTNAKTYAVQSGDTGYGIAHRFGISLEQLASWNAIENPELLRLGQVLRVSAPTLEVGLWQSPVALSNELMPGAWYSALGYKELYPPGYGSLSGKYHSGVDLNLPNNADLGKPIYAVQSGTVMFAQNSASTWGWLIVISHHEDVCSRYAHCLDVFVRAGETVKRGDKIGRIGNSNGRWSAHLHFDCPRLDYMRSQTQYVGYRMSSAFAYPKDIEERYEDPNRMYGVR